MRDGDSAFPSMCLINKGRLISGPFFIQLRFCPSQKEQQ
jgi:hypothetical protein